MTNFNLNLFGQTHKCKIILDSVRLAGCRMERILRIDQIQKPAFLPNFTPSRSAGLGVLFILVLQQPAGRIRRND